MILDNLKNAARYRNVNANIAKALDYLSKTNFAELPAGRYAIDGDAVYAMVQRYRLSPMAKVVWESHRKYIDVQFIAHGMERIGYAPLSDDWKVVEAYDPKGDKCFFEAAGDRLELREGSFAVFFPTDIHAPCLVHEAAQPDDEVLKVVVKCRCEQ